MGVSFDIVTEDTCKKRLEKKSCNDSDGVAYIDNSSLYASSSEPVLQPPYMFGSTQVDLWLGGDPGLEYYIVPSVKDRKQAGTYFVHVRIAMFSPQDTYC